MARAPRSSRATRRGAASRDHPQERTWKGVRERARGRWAAQVRVPGTRATLCIGRFKESLEAAVAYDAALFCFHGAHRLPSPRRFNFPTAPKPNIPEDVRATLTRADVKVIAASHARLLARFLVHLLPGVGVNPAPAAPPPPLQPAAAAAADGAAAVSGEANATSDSSTGSNRMG